MTTVDSEGFTRPEPLLLKPSTLPHRVVDNGAGGENIGLINIKSTPSSSSIYPVRTVSAISQTQFSGNESPCPNVLFISLRIFLYLFVLVLTIGFTLAACKFTNVWDPCDHLYINTTKCQVTSYMKGMVYHTDCTEDYYCILPGFESNIKRQGWSLHRPNDTNSIHAPVTVAS